MADILSSILLDVSQLRRHGDSSFTVDSPVELPECQGHFLFVANMIFGKSRPRFDFRFGIWPKGYR